MSPKVRRRRGLLLLALALLSGALAASQVSDHLDGVERRVGPLVPVAVAARDLRAGTQLRPGDLATRRVPAAYLPRGALASPAEGAGGRLAAPVDAGGYVTATLLGGAAAPAGRPLRRGERAVELGVSGGRALEAATPGSRVDVIVSTEPHEGAGRSFVALERVELLALRAGGGAAEASAADEGRARTATATATLRVTLRQAVYLAAAENFAREVRLLPRPPGDGARSGRAGVSAGDL